ncbi:hypothetical protein FQN57_000983 [Myotisia sp. PD_48]|nr:hypothetical protein FQN57_000983 [Myotisia sp. PD_48]
MADLPTDFLQPPQENEDHEPIYRESSAYNPLSTFRLPPGGVRHYKQQYADMYFLRLARLKPVVAEIAKAAWDGYNLAGERAQRVDRVLDVRQGQLSWVVGTVYMDLPLKPDILKDISQENWTAGLISVPTYRSSTTPVETKLEDESGRLNLTGALLQASFLVTGVVVAVLGTENANGDFEVVDVKVPGLPQQPIRWERGPVPKKGQQSGHSKKIAFISGLDITGTSGDTLKLSLLTDFILGYNGGTKDDPTSSSRISRLVIAGNSLGPAPSEDETIESRVRPKAKKYGYDASAYNPSLITLLDTFLAVILQSIPVTLMPGETDPANLTLPQQQIHRAMFPRSKIFSASAPLGEQASSGWFDSVTNPWEGDIEGWRFWGCSGQNVEDVLRYVDLEGEASEEEDQEQLDDARLGLMDSMLRWRCGVPTAPDTLWCYPFQDKDPFVLQACPHVFFAGNQPEFKTALVEGNEDDPDTTVRLLAIPRFSTTGQVVLLDTETLEVELLEFGMDGK